MFFAILYPTIPQYKGLISVKTFFIRTYGCQMNFRDSEKLSGLLTQLGYTAAQSQEDAGLILYNTCCVRESAEDKIWGHLSRLKNLKSTKPDLIIAVTGCMSQQPEIAETFRKKHPYVNIVLGTTNRHRFPEFLIRAIQTGQQIIDISEDDQLPELTGIPVTTREYPHKAGVNIMYGCDNYCSYCIVPYVRGREKSRPMEDILQEAEALAADGVKEIMLLGQNVNSYGLTPMSQDAKGFPELLHRINDIPGLERIRFMTSHPKDFSGGLIAAMRNLSKVCKSVHLPIQSGSTRILADMNRKYTQEDYLALIESLKAAIPGIAISTDIIVGYPGETEEDFQATLEVVRKARFAGAFTFMYSKRSGTPAAERTDIIPQEIVSDRFNRLTAEINPILQEINEAKLGKTFEVMVEESQPNGVYKGRTNDHTLVHFNIDQERNPSQGLNPGDMVQVRIETAKTFYVSGKLA